MNAHTWTQNLRVRPGFRLADVDPESKPGFDHGKSAARPTSKRVSSS